jgi:hypothetical protein
MIPGMSWLIISILSRINPLEKSIQENPIGYQNEKRHDSNRTARSNNQMESKLCADRVMVLRRYPR